MTEEGNLYDYFRLFWQKRKLFYWIMIITLGGALLLTLAGPKMYEVKKIVKIGKIIEFDKITGTKTAKLIEEPKHFAEKLYVLYQYKNIEIKTPTPFLVVKIIGFDKERLLSKTKEVKNNVLKEHQHKYDHFKSNIMSQISVLKQKIKNVQKEIQVLEDVNQDLYKTMTVQDNVTSKSILLERRDYLWTLKNQLAQFEYLISDANEVYPTAFVNKEDNVKLNFRWPVALIVIFTSLGIMLFVAIALIDNFRKTGE